MIKIKNVKDLQGATETVEIPSREDHVIDAEEKLTLLPALIDIHVHFRTPGAEYKENWITASQAAIAGGITTVFDMPNTSPSTVDLNSLQEKKKLINKQLSEAKIPLNYHLYVGADEHHLNTLNKTKEEVIAIKAYMGSSTGGLIMDKFSTLDRLFEIAKELDMLVAVHAEDEEILKKRAKMLSHETSPATHSKIRDRSAAIKAVEQAISLTEKYRGALYIMHVSTKEELDLIRSAKKQGLRVYAEATPHHLFLNENDYAKWGTKVQVNPPLRTEADSKALWEAIHDNTIDSIGSDHAPHTIEEKTLPFGKAPSGITSLELTLPLLLNAVKESFLSLEKLVALTRKNPERIFKLQPNQDVVLVDLEKQRKVEDKNLKTKCKWSPYAGRTLTGWPVWTILQGTPFKVNES